MIRESIYKRLAADSTVTSLLATYQYSDGAAALPAIFTVPIIPVDCGYPAIIISDEGGTRYGCRESRGASCIARIRIYGDRDMSGGELFDVAKAVWESINWADMSTYVESEYEDWGFRADPPAQLDDPDGFPGYMISVVGTIVEER